MKGAIAKHNLRGKILAHIGKRDTFTIVVDFFLIRARLHSPQKRRKAHHCHDEAARALAVRE